MSRFWKFIKREWELSILVVMIIIGLVGLVSGSIKAVSFWRGQEEPSVPRVNVRPKFTDAAFAYLKPTPAHQIGSNHAMKLQIPQEWLNKKRYERMLAERERMRREAELRRKNEIDRMASLLGNERPKTPKNPEQEKKPNPPIQHFMVFKGFMESPKGEILAYLGKEDSQGEVVKRSGAAFLRIGGQFKGYTVKQIDDEWVLLGDPNGKNVTIIRGQRHQYGVTANPDYLLEPEEAKTDDDVASNIPVPRKPRNPNAGRTSGNAKPNTGGRRSGKSAQDMIQDYLKKNKGAINQDTIKDLMKKNRVKQEDVERLFR